MRSYHNFTNLDQISSSESRLKNQFLNKIDDQEFADGFVNLELDEIYFVLLRLVLPAAPDWDWDQMKSGNKKMRKYRKDTNRSDEINCGNWKMRKYRMHTNRRPSYTAYTVNTA